MTTARRRIGLLLALLTVLLAAVFGAAPAANADSGSPTATRVLVVGVPGLTWADIGASTTPHLWDLAASSPIGSVSVRAVRSTTCLLDGWASLGAGNRVRVPGPDQGIPPIPLPEPGGSPTPTTGRNGAPATQYDSTLTYCGLQERVATIALSNPAADVQRRKPHNPLAEEVVSCANDRCDQEVRHDNCEGIADSVSRTLGRRCLSRPTDSPSKDERGT